MGLRDEWELFDVWFKEREGAQDELPEVLLQLQLIE